MEKYYFTFGQSHTHRYGQTTLDCDSVVQIEAADAGAARERMFEIFGQKWHNQHTKDTLDLKYFPRGVVLELT